MSIVIGAFAKKVLEAEDTVIYEYGSTNWNDPRYFLLELYPQLVNADKEAVIHYADDLVKLVESGEVDLEGRSKGYTLSSKANERKT